MLAIAINHTKTTSKQRNLGLGRWQVNKMSTLSYFAIQIQS